MAHARKQIRDALKAAVTGLAATGSNVHWSRSKPWTDSELPGLGLQVVTDGLVQNIDDAEIRELSISATAILKTSTDPVDDQLDEICAQVQAAIMGDSALGALATDIIHQQTAPDLDSETEKPVGSATMQWAIQYQVDPADPETILT